MTLFISKTETDLVSECMSIFFFLFGNEIAAHCGIEFVIIIALNIVTD